MNTEFISCLTVLWCCATYWLGGQELPGINKGIKAIRRFGLPIGLFIGLLSLLVSFWQALAATALLCAALHLGYQNKVWKYALTGLLMSLPSLLLGFHWTICLPAIFHTLFGYLSLRDNKFGWGYVALLMGISIGLCYLTPTG